MQRTEGAVQAGVAALLLLHLVSLVVPGTLWSLSALSVWPRPWALAWTGLAFVGCFAAPFLARQIELLSPQVLVLLGGAAAKNLLGATEGIMRLRGKWLAYSCAGRDIATLATLHPAFLLRNPEHKRLVWRDLLSIKEVLAQ